MAVSYDSWFCCSIDSMDAMELCKIKRRKVDQINKADRKFEYYIITYYDGREVYSGSMTQCREWINKHWVERRYLDQYGNV